jgi:hypothetical protein
MASDPNALTNTWMTNPYMFEPSQTSNAFSNYNNAALPWPPSYNTGAGGPVNAATGQPIQSFLDWQKANPGGMSINATPAAPAPPRPQQLGLSFAEFAPPSPGGPSTQAQWAYNLGLGGVGPYSDLNPSSAAGRAYTASQTPAAQPQAQPQVSGPPNNWQAAINSLANPGNPVTPGATVPLQSGTQPAGGVNQAFLQQAGAGQGMNQNFLNALRSIQGRPQGT